MHYLVFRLYGPMVSWGEIAVGESRRTAIAPKKSAITGLLASALGIRRDQEEQQQALVNSFTLATKVLRQGELQSDYHTTQAPDSAGKFVYKTRRDELVTGKDRLGTVLSTRGYLCDVHCVIAISLTEQSSLLLTDLQQALKTPKFQLFLGRKSNPLAAPLNPEIIEADNFYGALNAYELKPVLNIASEKQMSSQIPNFITDKRWLSNDEYVKYYWEGDDNHFRETGGEFNPEQIQTLYRRDVPSSRKRWQFSERTESHWSEKVVVEENN